MMEDKTQNIIEELKKLSLEQQQHVKNTLGLNAEMKGKTVLITGGNRGIGRCCVDKFAQNGANIVFSSSTFDQKANDIEEEVKKTYGVDILYVPCDVRKESDIDNLVEKTLEKFGTIDVLVNNAGKAYISYLEQMSLEDFEECIRINLTGPFLLCKKVAPIMRKAKWGRIINIASGTVEAIQPALSAYMAAKSGLTKLSKGLALEVAADNITVNSILPGPTQTDMLREGISGMAGAMKKSADEALDVIVSGNAIKRAVFPQDIAETVYFLAKEEAKSITGANYACDCGFTL